MIFITSGSARTGIVFRYAADHPYLGNKAEDDIIFFIPAYAGLRGEMGTIFTRYGDGSPLEMSESDLMADLETGTADAAERGNIPALNKEELHYLLEIFKSPYNFISVERGNEVILSYDAGTLKIRRVGVNVDRIQALQIYEKLFGADTMELCHVDYSFKPIKPIVTMERPILEQALLSTHIPLFYGAMPNLGLYSSTGRPLPESGRVAATGKNQGSPGFL